VVLDEPREKDRIFVYEGISFLVDEELFQSVRPVHIDYEEMGLYRGLQISSNISAGISSTTSCCL
jgi:Fe-S cluster assembly iron-binding protein IscA